jgi:hypothetical protein
VGCVRLWRINNCQAWRVDLAIDDSEVDHIFQFCKSVSVNVILFTEIAALSCPFYSICAKGLISDNSAINP